MLGLLNLLPYILLACGEDCFMLGNQSRQWLFEKVCNFVRITSSNHNKDKITPAALNGNRLKNFDMCFCFARRLHFIFKSKQYVFAFFYAAYFIVDIGPADHHADTTLIVRVGN